jgi:hypothetical protein
MVAVLLVVLIFWVNVEVVWRLHLDHQGAVACPLHHRVLLHNMHGCGVEDPHVLVLGRWPPISLKLVQHDWFDACCHRGPGWRDHVSCLQGGHACG